MKRTTGKKCASGNLRMRIKVQQLHAVLFANENNLNKENYMTGSI